MPLDEVFKRIGRPLFKLENRPVYYMGYGFLIAYTPRKFNIENMERIKYDNDGEYLLNVCYYQYLSELLLNMNVENAQYHFGEEALGEPFEVFDGINIGDTFKDISSAGRIKESSLKTYNEGESRAYNKDKGDFVFKYKWITWDEFEMYFFGKSDKTKLTAFQYTYRM